MLFLCRIDELEEELTLLTKFICGQEHFSEKKLCVKRLHCRVMAGRRSYPKSAPRAYSRGYSDADDDDRYSEDFDDDDDTRTPSPARDRTRNNKESPRSYFQDRCEFDLITFRLFYLYYHACNLYVLRYNDTALDIF